MSYSPYFIIIYCIAQIELWALGTISVGSYVLQTHTHLFFLSLFSSPVRSCGSPAPVHVSRASFYWRVIIETGIWAPDLPAATAMFITGF